MTEESAPRDPSEGRVAKVMSDTTVVINRGSEDGVAAGDRYQILSTDGEPVLDPENDEEIARIPYEKGRVQVTELYPRAAVASTFETHFVGGFSIGGASALDTVFGPRREVRDTFKAEVTDSEGFAPDLTVRVADKVRRISTSLPDFPAS